MSLDQFGFDFGGADEFVPIEKPAGTWESRLAMNAAAWTRRFEQAEATLLTVVGPMRQIYRDLLTQDSEAFEAQMQRMKYDAQREFSLWGARYELDDEAMDAIAEHCRTHEKASYPGIQYKVRMDGRIPTVAMHVDGLGSVVLRDWGQHGRGVDFSLIDRDTFFLDSYQDNAPRYELPYSLWRTSMMAQRLSESGAGVANVATFQHLGRDFFVTGISYGPEVCEAYAWSVVPACDWHGPTYSYTTQVAAYNEGILERGDHRGLLVKVRGQLCVVDGYSVVLCPASETLARLDYIEAEGGEDDESVDGDSEEADDELCCEQARVRMPALRREPFHPDRDAVGGRGFPRGRPRRARPRGH